MSGILAKVNGKSYPIVVDPTALMDFHNFLKDKQYSNCVLVYDQTLKKHNARLLKIIKFIYPKSLFIGVKASENLKSIKNIYPLYEKLFKAGMDRKSVIVSLGGGTIGDSVGFVASTYMRGIDWINIPTTLLAQVDSAVGGKTGINHERGKNLIGTFYQPAAVFIEPQFLKTLPQRELVSGLGETIKYGLILDKYFFYEFFSSYEKALNCEMPTLNDYISRCVRWKAQIISNDEKDTAGIRAVLNYGHTLGHALEKYYNYTKLNHGEAVIWGMKFAAIVSYLKNMIPLKEMSDVLTGLEQLPVPKLTSLNANKLWSLMVSDKKTENKTVKMVLLKGIGRAVPNQPLTKEEFKAALKIFLELK